MMQEDTAYRRMPHLEGAVPEAGQGKRISTYNVALEGWRRGLHLSFYGRLEDGNLLKLRYSLKSDEQVHHFSLSMGDKVSNEAFRICADKELTKRALAKKNVPVPSGKMFEKDVETEEIIEYAKTIKFPLVVKPTDGNAGKGVFANIENIESLKWVLEYVRYDLNYPEVLVEQYVSGKEFRIYVIEDKVIGAMNRRPASVMGDGVHTIRQLIEEKNKIRKANPHLTSRLIKVDKEVTDLISRANYQLDSIPEDGERVYLRQKSNLATGGDAIDVTEKLTPELEKIAIDAGKAIPGLAHYGVDMIVDQEKNTGVILEVNTRPGIGGHLYPMEGKPRDFAKEIIDYYFPDTKDVKRSNLYFDFDSIWEAIRSRSVEKVEVAVPPYGEIYGKQYIVSGEVQKVGYRNWIRKKALRQGLNGFTENLENGDVEIVVVGTDQQTVDEFREMCLTGPERAVVYNIEEEVWTKPVKMGFEIKRSTPAENEIRKIEEEKEKIEREKDRMIKRYSQITSSRTWKIMSPVRYVSGVIKKMLGLKSE